MTDNLETVWDGGPAFPRDHRNLSHNGMSLRDWFAGQALPGIIALESEGSTYTESATYAYQYADAMLGVRGRP